MDFENNLNDNEYESDLNQSDEIAIIGVAGKFPGADNISEFWENLKKGICSIKSISAEEARLQGVPDHFLSDPEYILTQGAIDNPYLFGAKFFSYSPKEASLMDPQQRLFLECCWEAVEDAGYIPDEITQKVGVFAASGLNSYFLKNILSNFMDVEKAIDVLSFIGNEKDFISTRVSYKFNYTGPSYTVQSACSSSLVSFHIACQNLLTYQCDMALCGGVSLTQPRAFGYQYKEGEILSKTGNLRVFDEKADGTIFGEGVGVVFLKRLDEALVDNDPIYAVVKSTSMNNDGADKIGFTAPSINGQSKAIEFALEMAEINPDSIGLVEAHGTGTKLGDPIELASLTQSYRKWTEKKNYCVLGSVKSNIGHLDVAAGITGLIKAALCLKNKKYVPQINYNKPNPELYLEDSPFYINDQLRDWPSSTEQKRRAAVSSFGLGGTNVHVILEEPPIYHRSDKQEDGCSIIPLSAKSTQSIINTARKIEQYIQINKTIRIDDIARTLAMGRKKFNVRKSFTCNNLNDFIKQSNELSLNSIKETTFPKKIIFLFPGQGSQYIKMGSELYKHNLKFKENFDHCLGLASKYRDITADQLLYHEKIDQFMKMTDFNQILLFMIEYSLSKYLMDLGISPDALLGHSLGEITAACVSGIFSLEEAIKLVCARGEAMMKAPEGRMLAVALSEKDVQPYLNENLFIAAVNSGQQTIISGYENEIQLLYDQLKQSNIRCQLLSNLKPFHSPYMKPVLREFRNVLGQIKFKKAVIPLCSNVTGEWNEELLMSDATYWENQIIKPVLFSKNAECVLELEDPIFIEIGPGSILSSLVSSSANFNENYNTIQCMPRKIGEKNEHQFLLENLGRIWESGIDIDWAKYFENSDSYRVPLPSTDYERKHYCISPKINQTMGEPNELESINVLINLDDPKLTQFDRDLDKPSIRNFIIALWKEALGYNEISLENDFFDLGGDSLVSAQIVSKINKFYSINLNSSILFEYPLLNSFVELIESQIESEEKNEYQIIEKRSDIEAPFPLTTAQKRLWFLHKFNPELPIYNLAQGLTINGTINYEILNKAIVMVLSHHDVFRTRFSDNMGDPVALLEAQVLEKIKIIDLTMLGDIEPRAYMVDQIKEQTRTPFDFNSPSLYRIVIYKLDPKECRLILFIPHILSDGWSFDIFHHELETVYSELLNSSHFNFADDSIQYSDYAIWQALNLKDINLSEQLEFWKNYLRNSLSILQLPTDFNRPLEMKGYGDTFYFDLADEEAFIKLRKFSILKKCTHFSIVLSALSIFLHKYSGQQDVTIGTAYANRDHEQLENIFGFFINMLPIHVEFYEGLTFNHLIDKIMIDLNQAVKNSKVNFDQIVDILNVERIENVNPVFQVMIAYQNYMKKSSIDNAVSFQPVFLNRGISEYDLSFYIWEEKNGIRAALEYSTELFKESTIERFVKHFKFIFNLLIQNLDNVIENIELTKPEEKQFLLTSINNTECNYSGSKLLPHYFSKVAQQFKNKVAARSAEKEITYYNLEILSNQLAYYLLEIGIKKGEMIGVYLERSIDLLIILLGIQKAGAVYIPLDPDFPDSRIKLIIEDSKLTTIVSQKSLREKIKALGSIDNIFFYDNLKPLISNYPQSLPEVELSKDDLVYVLYTSGSTGIPNGVCISHFSLLNFLLAMKKSPGIADSDIMLGLTTLSFDISGLELYLPIISGATVEIISHDDALDGFRLKNIIQNRNITIMQATPATYQLLLESGWQNTNKLKVLCGGEALPIKLAERLIDIGVELWNMYGPTETTVWSSIYKLSVKNKRPLIGKPIDNTQFFILDKNMNPVPLGIVGELYIGGAGVAKGYLNRPELNRQRFIDNPFKSVGSDIIYKTGDLVRLLDDGNIEYVSRLDFQVKIRGYRIELQDIENALSKFKGVKQVVCSIINVSDVDKRILAYIRSDENLAEKIIRDFLKDLLPKYMIPNHFYFMKEFPLTPNGKIDRNSLPRIDVNQFNSKLDFQKPRNKMEEEMAIIWGEVLGLSSISIDENFFDLGGHSLLAAKLIHQLNRQFNYEFKLRDLFSNPTISQLASIVQNISIDTIPLLFPVQNQGKDTPLFLVAGVYDHLYYKDDKLINLYEEDFLRYFNNLIVNVGVDRPIYGLRPRGILLNEKFHKNVSAMALDYIKEIKKLQEIGPYLIGGECLGGIVAYEIAHQLIDMGDEVALCVLMDTYKPDFYFETKYKISSIKNTLINTFRKIMKNYKAIVKDVNGLMKLYRKICIPLSKNDRLLRRVHLGSHVYARKLISYRPEPYTGKLALLINENWNRKNPNLNWSSKYLKNMLISVVPGNHTTRLTTHGKAFGQILKKLINNEMINYH